MILVPSLVALGALLLICLVIGGTVLDHFKIGRAPVEALVLLALNAIVVTAKRDQLSALFHRTDDATGQTGSSR